MAIFQCEECGRSISDKASHCPGCGAPVVGKVELPVAEVPIRPQSDWRTWGIFAVLFAGLLGMLVFRLRDSPPPQHKSAAVMQQELEQEERRKAAMAIELCENEYKEMNADRKYTPDVLQFHSLVCQKMRGDYRAKWGVDP